ncbi:phage terminase large subunit [Paenibacillus filicis]|uniref:Phage terminase large subunit n=1 Tax=Paenibacillus gyeongsangnamensis TaxID=3388067 RepID=A0ABT4Q6G8_9BACL|nr:phage terminase large subunit [Paenibacillus filicis]MCZ8512413.1 phage terminase large subunit [Paenibacillus filicis]
MNDTERIEKINLYTEKVNIYEALFNQGNLDESSMHKYISSLKELERLKQIESYRYDIMAFAKRYFNNNRLLWPKTPSPEFHYDMAKMICNAVNDKDHNSFLGFIAPRSHAKTILGTTITALYIICFQIHPYLVIINNKQEGAKQVLTNIKFELENNDELIRDFGDMYNRRKWSESEIITANNILVEAVGSGDAIRGKNHLGNRPWVLIDDLEKDPDVYSPTYRDKMHNWFNSTIVPLGSPTQGGTKIIWVGTILHNDAVLNRIIKNDTRFKTKRYSAITSWPERMDLWEQWGLILNKRDWDEAENEDHAKEIANLKAREFYDSNMIDMEEGAEVLWKERISLYDLMVIRQANRKSFLTEYIGDPKDDTTVLFRDFTYYELSDINMDDLDIYGAVDPSLGKNDKSDLSAIVTVGKHKKTGIMYVLEVDAKRRTPEKIIDACIEKARIYNYRSFVVETVQFQFLFMTDLAKAALSRGVYLPIKEIPKPNGDKWLRISSLEPFVSNGFLRFQKNQHELIAELEDVGTDRSLPRKDDRSDALEMVVSQIAKSKRRGVALGSL